MSERENKAYRHLVTIRGMSKTDFCACVSTTQSHRLIFLKLKNVDAYLFECKTIQLVSLKGGSGKIQAPHLDVIKLIANSYTILELN